MGEKNHSGKSITDELTERERQVLLLLAEGYSVRQIAEALSVSVKTAETHRYHIYAKTGISNRIEALKYAIQIGAITL